MPSPDADILAVGNHGERHHPAADPESINHYRHLTAYHFALPRATNRRVLEFGCGTGYGFNLLFRRSGATRLAGCDLGADALRCVARSYGTEAARRLVRADGRLPFVAAAFDVVVAFQTIEHVHDDAALLREVARVLAPGGLLIVTTPNVEASGGDPGHPGNPFHVREYDRSSLRAVCEGAGFAVEALFVHGALRVGGGGLGLERNPVFRVARRLWRRARRTRYAPPVSLSDFDVLAGGSSRALDLLFLCRRP